MNVTKKLIEGAFRLSPGQSRKCDVFHAAATGDIIFLEENLKENNVDQVDETNSTCLHYAVVKGHLNVVKLLLELRADVNKPGFLGDSSLLLAVRYGQETIANHLMYAGADVNWQNKTFGQTALHIAAGGNELDKKEDISRVVIVESLCSKGCDIDAVDNTGNTALHRAARDGYLDIVVFLISRTKNPGQVNNIGENCLHKAVLSENLATISFITQKFIKEYNVSLDIKDNQGNTPLLLAAKNNSIEIVAHLIRLGATWQIENNDGDNCLTISAKSNYIELTKWLLQKKSLNVLYRTSNGRNIIDMKPQCSIEIQEIINFQLEVI